MKKLLIMLLCAAPSVVAAEQWQVLGTRPMGMGGAFVAVAQGPIAQYWNPAGLVKSSANVSGMEIPVGVSLEMTGDIMKTASEIGDMSTQLNAIQAAQNATSGDKAITPQEAANFVKTMGLLSDMNKPGKGALIEVAGGANFKFSKVALSINNFTSVGANPFIDTKNMNLGNTGNTITFASGAGTAGLPGGYGTAVSDLTTALNNLGAGNAAYQLFCGGGTNCDASITNNATLANALTLYASNQSISATEVSQAAAMITQNAASAAPIVDGALTGGSYAANTSNLTLAAASFTEIAAGYAWNLDKWMHGLSLGANLKLINGRMAANTFQFMNNSETGDAFKDMMENSKASWQPAADLGFLWDVKQTYAGAPFSPKVGLVMRNINSPSFDTPAGGDYDLDRQVRMGFAINPAKFWTLAADMDLTKNSTPVDGFDSRQLAIGTEINVFNRKAFNIPLRAGIMKNLAEKDSKLAYTLGTGLNLLFMHFDVSGVVSSERTTLDDSEIPTKVGVAASFGLLF